MAKTTVLGVRLTEEDRTCCEEKASKAGLSVAEWVRSLAQTQHPLPEWFTRTAAVYRMFDAEGQLLYVGVTSTFGRRMHVHSERKEWWPLVVTLTVEQFGSREEADAAERLAIATEDPVHNVVGTQHAHDAHRVPAGSSIPVMVRMSTELLAKLDADRGELNRSEWIRRLVARWVPPQPLPKSAAASKTGNPGSQHPSGEEKPNSKPKSKSDSKPSPQFTKGTQSVEKASKCAHPPNRRLGDGCAACGVTGLKK